MPSLQHQALVDLFRGAPHIAFELLRDVAQFTPPPDARVHIGDAALDQLVGTEHRADLVLELRDDNGRVRMAVVLEVQRAIDPDKRFAWPLYVAAARWRHRCEALLLVVTPDARVAEWAAHAIAFGSGGSGALIPFVVGPDRIPAIRDVAVARANPHFAVLSAIAHGNEPTGLEVVAAALAALDRLDDDTASQYDWVIQDALNDRTRKALEEFLMERNASNERPLAPYVVKLLAQAEAHGEAHGEALSLLRVLDARGLALSDAQRAAVLACTDRATLERWLTRAVTAPTTDTVFEH